VQNGQGRMDDTARLRLLVAVLVSAALHLSLMFGVAVRRPGPAALSEPILAHIEVAGRVPALHRESVAQRAAAQRSAQATRPAPRPSPGGVVQTPAVEPAIQAAAPATVVPEDELPPVEMPLLADPTWYPAAQLDVFPAALEPVRPAYPETAADTLGQVTLLLLVDDTGRVHECSVVDAQPEGVFDEAAVVAFRSARFAPGRKDGRSVRSRVLVKVLFNPAQSASPAAR